jgi:hypothetical protein
MSLALALAPSLVATAAPATPTVNYSFEGNSQDSGNGSTFTAAPACPADPCNSSTSYGADGGDGYLEWSSTNARGGGFVIDTQASLTNTYTILMKFTFADFSSYRKIIDYLDRDSDTGFYIYDSRINFYPLGNSANTFTAGQPLTLMVTRQATTGSAGVFTVYSYNGTTFSQELQVTDSAGTSIPATSTVHAGGTKLGFFFDDTDTSREATTSGKVFSIKMWSGSALSSADLQTVATAAADSSDDSGDSLANTGGGLNLSLLFAGMFLVCSGLWLRNRQIVSESAETLTK